MAKKTLRRTLISMLEWIETHYNLIWVYLDISGRWITQGKLGDWYDAVYLLIERIYDFAEEFQVNDQGTTKYCIDEDGLHFKGEEWQLPNKCHFRKCIAHNTIKEIECPVIPGTLPKRCSRVQGDLRSSYPSCCDTISCEGDKEPPIIRRSNPVYWKQEGYNYAQLMQ